MTAEEIKMLFSHLEAVDAVEQRGEGVKSISSLDLTLEEDVQNS